jgi:fructose-1,6-bisphosphatase I
MLYEAQPLAFLAAQAGGSATDGHIDLLKRTPLSLHERTPLYIGEKTAVARLQAAFDGVQVKADS